MKRNHARLVLVLSVFLFSLVVADFANLPRDLVPTEQQNTSSLTPVQAVNQIGAVITPKNQVVGKVAGVATSSSPLKLHITDPIDQLETTNPDTTLRGFVSDYKATVSAQLNGRGLGRLSVSTMSGVFDTTVTLDSGLNKIIVTALSKSGALAVASVSATLLQATTSSLLPMYLVLGLLAILAAIGIILAIRNLSKGRGAKSNTPWENNQTPKVS